MKNLVLSFALLLLGAVSANAQLFSFGIKGGVNTQLKKPDDILVMADSAFNFGVKDFKFGTQFGAWFRIGDKIFLQPEVLFNSNRTDYRIRETSLGEIVKNEKYQNLDFPIMAGFKAGPLRFSGGPVGHYFLNSNSELTDFEGYKARFKQFTWGWQAGVTLGTGVFSVDARYEGNFNKAGDHVTFFGQPYHFSNTPSRLVIGLNIRIF